MKRNKLFAFLCVALGTVTLFAGCGGETSSTKTGNFTDDDFVKMSYKSDAKYYASGYNYEDGWNNNVLNETYGEYVTTVQDLAILFRKTDKDFMNNVVDTYTLYNIYSNKAVWTHVSKYEDIDTNATDEYGNRKYPEKTEKVYANEFGVTVKTTTYTRLDDELIEEEGLKESYTWKDHYAFYDVNGKKVAESDLGDEVKVVYHKYSNFSSTAKILFGGTTIGVYEQDEQGGLKLIKTYKASTQEMVALYDYATDKYGYMMDDGVEIYDRATGALKYSYSFATTSPFGGEGSMINVLANGDVLVQYMEMSQDPNADVVIPMYGIGMNILTEIISVETGARRAIECDYMFEMVVNKTVMGSMSTMENVSMEIGDCFINCGMGIKLEDLSELVMSQDGMEEKAVAVFFDNNGKVQHTMAATAVMKGDADLLPDGSYLQDVDTPLTDATDGEVTQVILNADGTVRTYLPSNARVVDDFVVVIGVGIYDFDMKQICAWDEIKDMGMYGNLEYVDSMGDNVILKDASNTYYQIGRYSKNGFAMRHIAGNVEDINTNDNYAIITYTWNNGGTVETKRSLYNIEMEELLGNIDYDDRIIETKDALIVIKDGDVYRFEAKQLPTNYVSGLSEKFVDNDGNGIPDYLDEELRDWNENGIPDFYESYGGPDSNGDNIPDDYDKNENGIDDRLEEWM